MGSGLPANGASPGTSADLLFGRSRDLALVNGLLDRTRTDGEALVLFGEPGVGKSVLLDAAASWAAAAGTRVLRATGVEFEADIAFAALHQVLLPLFADFDQLSAVHRDALNVALALGEGAPPGRLLVSSATLTLFVNAAAQTPLLVIVDDLPWLDRVSSGVLGFVARRLRGSRIAFLAAARTGEESFFDRAGLPEHELSPLDDDAAQALTLARFPHLDGRARRRVLAEARGNPLALLELSAATGGSRSASAVEPPTIMSLNRRLHAVFASRIEKLPDPTRRLLLLTALDGAGDLRVIQAAGSTQDRADPLAAAERAQLVYVDKSEHRLAFHHPLIRSTVVALATEDDQRNAHGALAELFVDQPDRRVWHLAAAAIEPQEDVASLLEQAAERGLRRGDAVGAVTALVRASELSPFAASRARRLTDAAFIGAFVTGDLSRSSELLDEARRADPTLRRSLRNAVTAAYVLLDTEGDVDTTHGLLVGALEDRSDSDESEVEEALFALLRVCLFGCRGELWSAFEGIVASLERVPKGLSLAIAAANPITTTGATLEELDREIADLDHPYDPTRTYRIAIASLFVGRLPECRQDLWRVVRDGRHGGAVSHGIRALFLLANDSFICGRWDEAADLCDEGSALCEQHGYQLLLQSAFYVQGLLAAGRGDEQTALAATGEIVRWCGPRGIKAGLCYAWWARTLLALGRGDFEEAFEQAIKISPAGSLVPYTPWAMWVMMDLVHAAIRTGRHIEAAAHVAAIRAANVESLSSRTALLARGAAAIVAPDSDAVEAFDAALGIPGVERWPFDLARVRLAYGERLRRGRAMNEARIHLAAAQELFESVGAHPWAAHAANELRATGQRRPRGIARDPDVLTPQEHEIAMLAAKGLSNKQIGERLFLSHRTVAFHLHRTFPKLGITSRAGLRDALSARTDEATGHRANEGGGPSA
jgi:DNA-binding CsgD family transcriptional regulator